MVTGRRTEQKRLERLKEQKEAGGLIAMLHRWPELHSTNTQLPCQRAVSWRRWWCPNPTRSTDDEAQQRMDRSFDPELPVATVATSPMADSAKSALLGRNAVAGELGQSVTPLLHLYRRHGRLSVCRIRIRRRDETKWLPPCLVKLDVAILSINNTHVQLNVSNTRYSTKYDSQPPAVTSNSMNNQHPIPNTQERADSPRLSTRRRVCRDWMRTILRDQKESVTVQESGHGWSPRKRRGTCTAWKGERG